MIGGELHMTGLDKAREVAEKLKTQKTVSPEAEVHPLGETQMAKISENLRKMMQSDARDDMKENGAQLPFLSLFDSARSTKTLADGSVPHDGWFLLSSTQEEFDSPLVHIFHISRGFRVMQKNSEGVEEPKYMHMVSGVIQDDVLKPFLMTIQGQQRVQRLWEFRDVLRKLNQRGFPTFSLLIQLGKERVQFKDGKGKERVAKVITFTLSKSEGATDPDVVDDADQYMDLRNRAIDMKQYEQQYMDRYEVDEDGERVIPVHTVVEEAPPTPVRAMIEDPSRGVQSAQVDGLDDIDPEKIPF